MADSLLPPNATELETAVAETVARLSDVPVPLRSLWDTDACPASLLPWLAWALSVDMWDSDWSEDRKRQVIRESIALHRKKGTVWAVDRALELAGLPVTVEEWFDHAGDPGTFRLIADIGTAGFSATAISTARDVALRTKNVRSHLDAIVIHAAKSGGLIQARAVGVVAPILTGITARYGGAGALAAAGVAWMPPVITTELQEA
jgi:phage tail P2-like protein